jgi:hypothetical protein
VFDQLDCNSIAKSSDQMNADSHSREREREREGGNLTIGPKKVDTAKSNDQTKYSKRHQKSVRPDKTVSNDKFNKKM